MKRAHQPEGYFGDSLFTPADVYPEALEGHLQHFEIQHPAMMHYKLMSLCTDSDAIELWADFDNTLSARAGGVWEALRNALPADGRAESDAERRINLAKERAGTLTPEEHVAWSQRELGRYVRYGVTEEDIVRAVEAMDLRTGARELFRFCSAFGIDRYIVSTSVADAIELVVGLHTTDLRSNRLRMRNGVVVGWEEGSLLHSGNKHVHAAEIRAGRPKPKSGWKIILGDNRHDADILPDDNALRVRMQGKYGNTPDYIAESFSSSPLSSGFDLILRTDSLVPVVDLLRWIMTARIALL